MPAFAGLQKSVGQEQELCKFSRLHDFPAQLFPYQHDNIKKKENSNSNYFVIIQDRAREGNGNNNRKKQKHKK